MARKRTISQSTALLVGPTPATGSHIGGLNTLWALQSLNLDWKNQKQDVQVYGVGAPIGRETINPPEVTLDFSYLITSTVNESLLYFNLDGATSALANFLRGDDDRNYFIFVAPEGSDAVGLSGASSNIGVVGIGNGFISSYSLDGAVGSFPTASIQVKGLNWKQYTSGANIPIPAVNPTTGLEVTGQTCTIPTISNYYLSTPATTAKVIKPGDIVVSLSNAGGIFYDYNDICAQSFKLSFDLNRVDQNCLGSRFTTSKDLQFPINVNFEVDMIAKDIKTGSLTSYLCDTGSYSATVNMYMPSCASTGARTLALGFKLNNISLEGQSLSTSVGGESQILKSSWIGQIGGTGDVVNGFFMSGSWD